MDDESRPAAHEHRSRVTALENDIDDGGPLSDTSMRDTDWPAAVATTAAAPERRILLAGLEAPKGCDIDALFLELIDAAQRGGARVGGLVQVGQDDGATHAGCDTGLALLDVRTGARFNIWENRGRAASGCRLDENGLVAAGTALDAAIADGVDLLVINRFGKAESLGRGFLSQFADAVDREIPTLTSVRAPYRDAWDTFHGGCAEALACDRDHVERWIRSAVRRTMADQSIAS